MWLTLGRHPGAAAAACLYPSHRVRPAWPRNAVAPRPAHEFRSVAETGAAPRCRLCGVPKHTAPHWASMAWIRGRCHVRSKGSAAWLKMGWHQGVTSAACPYASHLSGPAWPRYSVGATAGARAPRRGEKSGRRGRTERPGRRSRAVRRSRSNRAERPGRRDSGGTPGAGALGYSGAVSGICSRRYVQERAERPENCTVLGMTPVSQCRGEGAGLPCSAACESRRGQAEL